MCRATTITTATTATTTRKVQTVSTNLTNKVLYSLSLAYKNVVTAQIHSLICSAQYWTHRKLPHLRCFIESKKWQREKNLLFNLITRKICLILFCFIIGLSITELFKTLVHIMIIVILICRAISMAIAWLFFRINDQVIIDTQWRKLLHFDHWRFYIGETRLFFKQLLCLNTPNTFLLLIFWIL